MYINPYYELKTCKGQWLKANFHTHAGTGEGTCGAYKVDDVVALYKETGYNVLTISNHDSYLDMMTNQSQYSIVMFNGFEYSQDRHMLCLDAGNIIFGTYQEVIDECKKQGGFTVLCHPNYLDKEYWPWKEIDALRGYEGIEIYNGTIFMASGSGLATDTWDYLLSQGKLVWGFANDDFHRWYDLARAWNMIYTPSENHGAVKNSILGGCFYTSTGLILKEMVLINDTIRISASAKDTYVKNYRYLFIGKDGQILSEQNSDYGEYHMTGYELYVRVQVISEHGAMLWTQPIYKKEMFEKP